MTYLPFVDGLRAVAILAVVAFHAVPWVMPGGFAGVDVFFVISGFLITRFIAAEMADGTFSLGRFYVRRARRLLPAALVCFVFIAALSALVLLPDAYWYLGRSLLSALLMYANIFFYHTGGYFSAPSLEKPLLHTWSLAVEDQFYLTWPLIMIGLLPRVSRTNLTVLGLTLCLASIGFAEYKIGRDPEFAFFLLPTRAWELLTGAFLALLAANVTFSKSVANALALFGVAAIVLSFALLSPDSHFPGLGAVPACLGTVAVIAASLNQPTLVSRALARPPVVFIGLISYSLYLWHWPLIALASYRLERPLGISEAAAVVALSFGAAVLSWRFIERPFRKAHRSQPERGLSEEDRRFAVSIATCVALTASIALMLKIEKGLPQRYDAGVRTLLDQMVATNPLRGSCDGHEHIFANDDVCNFGRRKAAGESYEFALFGDSMADQWSLMVAGYADKHQLAGRQVTNSSCPLLVGLSYSAMSTAKARECAAYQLQAEKFVAANPKLKMVVISGNWETWLRWLKTSENPPIQNQSASEASDLNALTREIDAVLGKTIKLFTDRGIQVVLIGQIPTYAVLPVRCAVAAVHDLSDATACGMPMSAARTELAQSNGALTRAAKNQPLVSVSLPFDFMCQSDKCWLMHNRTFLYKNAGHLNRFGALALGDFVAFPELR